MLCLWRFTGGDGGSGADGGTGGDGGDISVTVDERDMDFVMLYSRPDFNGGHGGMNIRVSLSHDPFS
jgi:hypothetical protein